MDHPIVANLKMARQEGWERLRMLAGQWVYWHQNPNPSEEDKDRFRPKVEIQAEMLELMNLLVPKQELEFVVYTVDSVLPNAVYLKIMPHGVGAIEVKPWIGAPMLQPIDPSIAPPGADRTTDDVAADLLRSLEP